MEYCAETIDHPLAALPRQRRHPRYALRSLAYVKLNQGNGGIVRDLTESGIAIQAVAPLQPGEEVTLRFDLLAPRIRVETRGRIAWADANGQGGIEFDLLPPRMQRALRDWLFQQLLSAAALPGRDTIFSLPDPQYIVSPESHRPAIVVETPALSLAPEPRVQWGLFAISEHAFSTCIDTVVLACAMLLFSISSLAVMGSLPAWPLAAALFFTSSTIFIAVYQMLFSDYLCGASPGKRLAALASGRAIQEEPAARFR